LTAVALYVDLVNLVMLTQRTALARMEKTA
jgi:hypothetical protein